jgi:hypothetical protein
VAEKTKTAKEQKKKMTNKLKIIRGKRDLMDGSMEYAIDRTLCENWPAIRSIIANV